LAILVRVLMLVACGPLLVPPGFCVCNAGEAGCTPLHCEHVAAHGTDAAPVDLPDHCSHRHGPAEATASDHVQAGLPTPHPSPAPHDHAPGCPAATAGVERPQRVEPTADASPVLVPAPFVGFLLAPVTGGTRPPSPPTPWPSPLPLYLSHCSLVI
jgi:hypothetical protein